jgi:hypothetical protein
VNGKVMEIPPEKGGMPDWFLQRLAPDGEWSEFALVETVDELCSYSFATVEDVALPQLYAYEPDKRIYPFLPDLGAATASAARRGYAAPPDQKVLIVHPLLHEIARLWIEPDQREEYQRWAEAVAWHAIDDDVGRNERVGAEVGQPRMAGDDDDDDDDDTQGTSSVSGYRPGIILGGGLSRDPVHLVVRLDETFRHIRHFAFSRLNRRGGLRNGPVLTDRLIVPEPGDLESLYFCFVIAFILRINGWKTVAESVSMDVNWDYLSEELRRMYLLRRSGDLTLQWLRLGCRLTGAGTLRSVMRGREFEVPYKVFGQAAAEEMYLYRASQAIRAAEKRADEMTDGEGEAPAQRKLERPPWEDWDGFRGTDIETNVRAGFEALHLSFRPD